MSDETCHNHAIVAAAIRCSRCGHWLCHLCTFEFAGQPFCPDCATAGPSAEERSKVFGAGLLSVALAVAGWIVMAGLFVAGAAGVTVTDGMDRIVTFAWLLAAVGGLGAGLVGREGAKRTGSMLPLIGMIASGLLLAVLFGLMLFNN